MMEKPLSRSIGMSCKVFLLCAVVLLQVTTARAEGEAPELTADNFDSTLKESEGIWLLEFFAPWCGHCKRLSPEWDKAAVAMKEEGVKVHLAKVDCTSHSKICDRYDVDGYPSLRVLSSTGENLREYRGGRTGPTIASYARRLAGPQITDLKSTKELKDFIAAHEAAFVLYTPATESEGWEELKAAYEGAAAKHYDVANLAIAPEFSGDDLDIRVVQDGKFLQEDDGLGGRIVVYRENEGKSLTSTVNRTVEDVAHWINGHRGIMIPKIDNTNYRDIGGREKPVVICVMRGRALPPGIAPDSEEAYKARQEMEPFENIQINAEILKDTMPLVAKAQEDNFSFGYIDGKAWQPFVTKYGISTRVLPRLLIMDVKTEHYLPVPVELKKVHEIIEFLEKVNSGEIKMTRNLDALFKVLAKDYWHIGLLGLVVAIVIPIGWSMWGDIAGSDPSKKDN